MAKLKIHHLNCGTYCTRGIPFVLEPSKLSTRVLLIETDDGLVAVDSGFSEADLTQTGLAATLPQKIFAEYPKSHETLKTQLTALGFAAKDVRHVVLTHLDPDHAGGLRDFPEAAVHVNSLEYYKALNLRDTNPVWSYRLRGIDWTRAKKWHLYDTEGERWNGLECVRGLKGIKADLALVPLMGHTPGHAGVLVGDSTLHAGDLFYHASELELGLNRYSALSRLLAFDNVIRMKNLETLAGIRNNIPGLEIFSAHDYDSWLERHSRDRQTK